MPIPSFGRSVRLLDGVEGLEHEDTFTGSMK